MNKPIYPFLIAVLFLFSCKSTQTYVTDLEYQRYTVGDSDGVDNSIESFILPYRNELSATMNTKIATNTRHMPKRKPNSLLGNWFADVLLESSQQIFDKDIHFAAQNYGGLRVPAVGKGDITVGTIYELMPFDNTLVILESKGDIVEKLVQRIAAKGGWPISKGLSFTLSNGEALEIEVAGEALDMNMTYRFALPDYIANGGDDCYFLESATRYETGKLLRDVIIEYLQSSNVNTPLVVDETKRIKTN